MPSNSQKKKQVNKFYKYLPKDSVDAGNNVFNSLCFNLTNSCNTTCKYCFQNANTNPTVFLEKTVIFDALKYFKQKAATEKCYVQFTGGEIFLHPDIFEILQFCVDNNWSLRLQTNGMLIPSFEEKSFSFLKDTGSSIRVSLDGPDEKSHEFMRARGSFSKAIQGIRTLQKYFKYVVIKSVVHRGNIDRLDGLCDFCIENNIFGVSTNILRNEGFAKEHVDKRDIVSVNTLYRKLVDIFNNPKYSHLIGGNDIAVHFIQNTTKLTRKSFYIDYDGRVYPDQNCQEADLIGDIYADNFDVIFDDVKEVVRAEISEELLKYIRKNLGKEVLERWKCKYMEETNR